MDVSDEIKERMLDEEIYAAMVLLAVIYPPGCSEMIVIPEEGFVKKSKNRLTLRLLNINLYKLIVNKGWLKMALTQCPECKKEISDSAPTCPNCGYVIKSENVTVVVNQKKGLGCISTFFIVVFGVIIAAAILHGC